MTDQTSVTVRFVTESNAMETAMDMVEPIPDPMNHEVFSSYSKLMGKAMMHCDRMDEAFSMIQAVHKDAMDINDFNTIKSRKDDLKKRADLSI